MSRKKRLWYPGATYHVMSRGNRRTTLYKDQSDFLRFLECIEMAKKTYNFKIHSLCLMTNHFHMSIETGEVELWRIMQKILHPYSMDFNHRYHFTGHLFESRYNACIIEDERYFLEVSRYIHLNPVKAAMVSDPLAYEYSSYRQFVLLDDEKTKESEKMIEDLVDTSRVLSAFMGNSREQYRLFVESKISHVEQEQLIQKDLKEDDMYLP